jgi:hypothetical protein
MKDYLSIPICDDILDAKRCPTPEMRSNSYFVLLLTIPPAMTIPIS